MINKNCPDKLEAAMQYFAELDDYRMCCIEPDGKVYTVDSWQTKTPFTTEQEAAIDAKLTALVAAWKAEEYQLKRTGTDGTTDTIYPSVGEQLDYIYHNGIDKWKTDIVDPVKAKYPKPE